MSGRIQPIARLTDTESTAGSVGAVLVTGLAIVAVFVGLGLVSTVVYDALPRGLGLPGLLVTLAVLGFGGLYAVLRVGDLLR